MAYSQQHLKFTFLFRIKQTDEIADTSINYTRASGAWAGAAATLAEVTDSVLQTMMGSLSQLLGTTGGRWADYSELEGMKVSAIGTDGSYVADPKLAQDAADHHGTTIGNPPQMTTVLSLRSATGMGTGNRGRMYLPHFYMSGLTASPYTDTAQAGQLAQAAGAMIAGWTTAINTVVTAPLYPAIMSQAGAGSAKQIVKVQVGTVSDTQRRRRNALNEVYLEGDI